MNNIKLVITLLLITISNLNVFAQENIYFNFDFAVFKADDQKSILEIYYSVNQKSLTYNNVNGNFEAFAKLDILLTNRTDNSVVFDKSYKSPSTVKDTSGKELNQNIIGQINFLLDDGYYKLKIAGSDLNNTSKQDILEEDLSIINASSTDVRLSNIELSTNIRKSNNESSNFYKNTLEVIPNPSNLFGMNLKELYYYYEIYGLNETNVSEEFTISYSIVNLNNESVISFDKKIKRNSEARVEYGKINVDTLERGSYFLKVNLLDPSKSISVSAEKKFFIFNVSEVISQTNPQTDYLLSEYAAKDEKDLDIEFAYATYLMTEKERDRYEDMKNIDAKRKYMCQCQKKA